MPARVVAGTAVFLVAYVLIGLATLTTFPLVWSDEAWYAQSAWSLITDGTFAVPMFADFAGFDIDNTVYGRLYILATAAAFDLAGTSIFSARLVSFVSGLVAVAAVFGVGRELWNPRVGLMAALLLAVSPVFVDQTHDARPEIMQVAVTLIAFYLLLLGRRRQSRVLLLSSGVVASLAADAHFNGIITPAALFAVLLVLRADRRLVLPFALGAGLGAAWWLAVHVLPDVDRFIVQTRAWGYPAPITEILVRPVFHIGMEVARYLRVDAGSLVLLAAALVAVAVLLRHWRDRQLLAVLAYVGVVLLFMLLMVGNKQPIYAVLLWPMLAILVARLLSVSSGRVVIGGATAIVVISLLSSIYAAWRDAPADYDRYVARIREAIPSDARVLGQPSAWFGFVGQPYLATQYFIWRRPFEEEVRRLGVEYVIADEYLTDLQLHWLRELPADEVESFLEDHAEVVIEIEDLHYGRLQSAGDRPFLTRVYRVVD